MAATQVARNPCRRRGRDCRRGPGWTSPRGSRRSWLRLSARRGRMERHRSQPHRICAHIGNMLGWYGQMRVIARSTLSRFVERLSGHKDRVAVKSALDSWYWEVERARWRGPADVKSAYANASIVGSERVVFNIKGNSYKLVAAIDYRRQIVFIKWLGSHREYDRIDVRKVEYGHQTYPQRKGPRGSTAGN